MLVLAIDAPKLVQPVGTCPRCGGELLYDGVAGWPLAIPAGIEWCGACERCDSWEEGLPPPPALDTISALSADDRDRLATWLATYDRERAVVVAHLTRGDAIETSLGFFYTVLHEGYEGRNPRTGAVVPVAPTRTVHFKSSAALHALVAIDSPAPQAPRRAAHVYLTALHDAVVERIRESGVARVAGIGVFCRSRDGVELSAAQTLRNAVNDRAQS